MKDTVKSALRGALRRLLEPLARLMIDSGIGVGEFHQLSKAAFVKAAAAKITEDGKTSISGIALITGLTRADVRTLLATDEHDVPEPERSRHRAERVLTGWWNDPDFLEQDGNPKLLRMSGKGPTFETLARRYSGDPRIRALRTELLRAKTIAVLPDGRIQVLSRTFGTSRWEPDAVTHMGERARDLVRTLLYNLRNPTRTRFERTVMSTRVDPRFVPLLLRDISDSADALSQTVEDAVSHPRSNLPERSKENGVRLGITIFAFEEAPEERGQDSNDPPAATAPERPAKRSKHGSAAPRRKGQRRKR